MNPLIKTPLIKTLSLLILIVLANLSLTACDSHHDEHEQKHGHDEHAEIEIEKGEHNGRLLHDKNFTLELAIFETGVPPEYRAWAYWNGELIAATDVQLQVRLTRLGNKIDSINFAPQGDLLRGDRVIDEPHSFIVTIEASYKGKLHHWTFDSFEGRTHIEPAVAQALNITTEVAGPADLHETIDVYGTIVADPTRESHVQARFNGVITAVHARLGERVKAGQVILSIESNESLKAYKVSSPIDGVITHLSAKVGQQTQGQTLMHILDNTQVVAELAIFPSQLAQVKTGAKVTVFYGDQKIDAHIEQIGLEANANQSVTARVMLTQALPLGAMIKANVEIDEYKVPLAVKRTGLQAFRDFTVVYAQVGNEYEVRMLELGRVAGEWVEVLSGLELGTTYVTENSFIIKADIEKSGASHDH